MTRSNGESLRAGAALGRYRIIERIGGGGMGEVYRARDADLERDVALKVLPPHLTGSEDRVRRFIQEAKTASGLNHPNIVVIHEIGAANVDGSKHHFIAMELIDGETFREKIYKQHRDLKPLLGHAAQAADALAKAHAAGIVHRDLKPDNLMVTRDGFAKVLDFGLAKLTEIEDHSKTQVRPDTRDGMVMGTIGYMSPEQAEGKPVDARSDIFSFGCILYEIATRERPFKGPSQVDVLHAIVHDEPKPVTEINPNAPPELRRIIRRCLMKDPDQRFHSMKDLASTLRDLVEEYDQLTPGSGSSARLAATAPAKKRMWPWIAGAALIVAASLLYLIWQHHAPRAATPAQTKIARITSHGTAVDAAISPDGRHIAYITADRGNAIRVRQVATRSEIEVRPPTEEVGYADVMFSPDGERVYVRTRPRGSLTSTVVAIPSLGGEPRRMLHDVDSRPAFSPDGKSVAFVRVDPGGNTTRLIVAGADGTNERVLMAYTLPDKVIHAEWSKDGEWLAAVVTTTSGGLQARMDLISPDGKTKRRLTPDRWFHIAKFAWLPDTSGIIASAQKADVRRNQLWHISFPDGVGTPITNDLSHYDSPSLSADGKTLLAVQGQERPRIWRTDLATGDSVPVTDERAASTPWFFDDVAADGAILYQTADGSGTSDIWSLLPDGSPPKRVTDHPAAEFSAALPRTGDAIYFQLEDERGFELWATDRSGGSRRRIASLPPANTEIAASPDGRWVLYPTPTELLRFSTSDGSRRVLTKLPPEFSAYSPDGTKIAFGVRDSPRRRMAIIDAETGALLQEVPRVPEQYSPRMAWAPDGKSLFVKQLRDGVHNIWIIPLEGGAPRQLTKFTDRGIAIGAFEVAPDGKSLYVGRASQASDVVMITDFR